jgi:hypothetical protein
VAENIWANQAQRTTRFLIDGKAMQSVRGAGPALE